MNRKQPATVIRDQMKQLRKTTAHRNGKPGVKPRASLPARPAKVRKSAVEARHELTIHELGWTRNDALKVRAQLAAFAADWDDPGMDVYNEN